MNLPEEREEGGVMGEVLTREEEDALATVRAVVEGLRAHSADFEFKEVIEALEAAGATRAPVGRLGDGVFSLGSARFELRPMPGDRIEVRFKGTPG